MALRHRLMAYNLVVAAGNLVAGADTLECKMVEAAGKEPDTLVVCRRAGKRESDNTQADRQLGLVGRHRCLVRIRSPKG